MIRIEKLVKHYGDVHALRGVDLEIERGGVVGILGPNGAGKTTLVETLEGLRVPTSGRIEVLGLDPSRQPRELKEKIGVQLQSTSLPPDLRVEEILRLFAAFYAKTLPADDVLERVGLEEKKHATLKSLSGGQRQRVAIAIALIHDPELVLLDEPTTGLDPAARRSLHEVVAALRDQGRTTLLTTHYIEEAELLCDRVIMMKRGRVVADGSPFELVGRAQGRSTLWIAVDGELDPAPLEAIGAEDQGRQGEHHRFSVTDPAAAISVLGDLLRAQSLKLVDLRLKRPTLEDVYLEVVGEGEDA